MLHHVVLHEGRIHQKPVLFLGTFLRCNHNCSQMGTTCLGSIHVCHPLMGNAPHGIFLVPKSSFLNASYHFTRSSCCLLQPSLSLPPASVIIFLYARPAINLM